MIELISFTTLNDIFHEALIDMKHNDIIKAYVTSILVTHVSINQPVNSVVLAYCEARRKMSFDAFQRIGDDVVWFAITLPILHEQNKRINEELAKLSYDACDRFLNKKLPLYDELASDLTIIIDDARKSLKANGVGGEIQKYLAKKVFVWDRI